MYEFIIIFLVSFLATFLTTRWIIPKLKKAKLTGKDMNKEGNPEIPEMGGFGILFGISSGILIAVGIFTFIHSAISEFTLIYLLAALSTILLMSIVGIFDDLFSMHQMVKAILPLFAAFPLVAVKVGTTKMVIPLLGAVDFGVFYAFLLVPIGIAGCSNVTNMLAGFNGSEAGMGFVACSSLAFVAFSLGRVESLIILLSTSGALLAFLFYNWYPAKVLIGDIGTLSIGAVIASSVIIGNFETAGIIVIIPYAIDFFIKSANGMPSDGWWGEFEDGMLFCRKRPISLCQWIMKISGGISERDLVIILIILELIFGILSILTTV